MIFRYAAAVSCLIVVTPVAANAQQFIESITTREGTRSTGRTGAPVVVAPAALPDQSAWPLPQNGADWGKLGQTLAVPYGVSPVGQTFESAGLAQVVQPPPRYDIDRQGNEIFTSPVTGLSQTFGTNVQRIR